MQDPAPDDFESFLRDHYRQLRALALTQTRSPQDAEDLLHDTLAAVAKHWPVEHPFAYIATALRRRAQNHWRARDVMQRHLVLAAEPGEHAHQAAPDDPEGAARFNLALRSLSRDEYVAFTMYAFADMTQQDIAAAMFRSTTSVGTLLSEAKRKLADA